MAKSKSSKAIRVFCYKHITDVHNKNRLSIINETSVLVLNANDITISRANVVVGEYK